MTASPTKKIKTEMTKYQCLACQLNKNSLSELHWHQTYEHTSEELSMSIINEKGLVKILDKSASLTKFKPERSILSSFSKKPSQFYYLSSTILQIGNNEHQNKESPIDCSMPLTKREKDNKNLKKLKKKILFDSCLKKGIRELTKPLEFEMKENVVEDNLEVPIDCTLAVVKKEKILCDSSSNNTNERLPKNSPLRTHKNNKRVSRQIVDAQTTVKVERLELKDSNLKTTDSSKVDDRFLIDSSLEEDEKAIPKEFLITKDISMKDFLSSADELCTELEDLARIAAIKKAKKRKQ